MRSPGGRERIQSSLDKETIMPIKPHSGESQDAFMGRCMHELGQSSTKRPQDQMVAICMDSWRSAHGGKKPKSVVWKQDDEIDEDSLPDPEKGDDHDGFMERCLEIAGDTDAGEAACESKWEDAVDLGIVSEEEEESFRRQRRRKTTVQDVIARWQKIYGNMSLPELLRHFKKINKDAVDDLNPEDCPPPNEDENYQDYVDRCVEEMLNEFDSLGLTEADAGDLCETRAEEEQLKEEESGSRRLVHKLHQKDAEGTEFVLSDATPDRYGDVVDPNGWVTDNFKKNPIALFNHNADFPVGKWRNLRTERGALRGDLQCAPAGTSARIDEIRKLMEAGILKAVSVGFRAIEKEPIQGKGTRFTKSELVECSLVSVPANPNALAVVKGLKISQETQRLIFGEHADDKVSRTVRGEHADMRAKRTGEHADLKRSSNGGRVMTTLSERIESTQESLVALRDELIAHLDKMDNSNVSDADLQKTEDLNSRIAQRIKTLEALQSSERNLGGTAKANGDHRALVVRDKTNGNGDTTRLFSLPGSDKAISKQDAMDFMIRAGVVTYFSKVYQKHPEEMREKIAQNGYPAYATDGVRIATDIFTRAASAPAQTTVTGWAAELVQTVYGAFMALLLPKSIFPRLSGMGTSLTFGRAGKIIIPTRSATPTIAGSFVGEGLPIPVRQGAFTAITLTPKKMAVITTWTRELDEHSVPAIEGLLREAVGQDTSVAIDSVLIDTNAATAIRPPGIFNGVTPLTATAGGGIAAIVGDVKGLLGAITTATKGNVRNPVYLMNPEEVNTLIWTASTLGEFPFRAEVQAGNLGGVPIIDSGTVALKTVGILDAADFVSVGAEAPRFEVSDQATLHEEDTTPLPIVPGSGTASAPVRSLWQTDSLALRLIMPLNWTLRRAGVVAMVQNVTW
jgi:HK97 family phage prohead protease/HK97 family phage major capsid protein